jgi:hypothetical protein
MFEQAKYVVLVERDNVPNERHFDVNKGRIFGANSPNVRKFFNLPCRRCRSHKF